jgi:hypothetical protein
MRLAERSPSELTKPDGVWAVVFQIWDDEPVFHALQWNLSLLRATRCGRVVGVDLPWLPLKHALKIGKPCRGCWPPST